MASLVLKMSSLGSWIVLLATAASSPAAVWTVDDDFTDFPAADFSDIQSAIDGASAGDEVQVYPGTYVGTGEQVVDMLGKSIVLRGVGGLDQTIIDGESARRCLVSTTNTVATTEIDGFTLRGGAADSGGGIYVLNTSPTFRNCLIENCLATANGGGILLNDSDAIFEQCVIMENEAENAGGGVCSLHSDVTMRGCVIVLNSSGNNGGGVWADGCSFDFVQCDVIQNTTAHAGGGMHIRGPFATPRFDRCTFSNNSATGSYTAGGGVNSYECTPEFINCEMSGNYSGGSTGSGGGVLCWYSEAILTECEITGNEVTYRGGGLMALDCSPSLTSCDLSDNVAQLGGGLACEDHADPTLDACRVSGNHAQRGGGVWCLQFSRPHLIACLVSENTADIEGGGILSSTNGCNPAAGLTSFCHNVPTHIDGWSWQDLGGNCFVDTCDDVNGDGLPDACQCLPDFDGDEQVAIDDMLQLLAAWGCTACPVEDLNGDGIVDIDDLLAVMTYWGACN
ncbi:MAG: NosD domain-containing protein [Phycisphaerales bacterium]|jgi:hypothetical protein|nr:NosD domain-containing protein [Phycisphaerales bacterium]